MTFKFRKPEARRRRVIVPAGLTSRDALFEALSRAIPLPDYFGRNWDALDECLSDLSFVTADVIELVHLDVPALPASDLRTYLDILDDAVNETDGHQLEVVFPADSATTVGVALKGANSNKQP